MKTINKTMLLCVCVLSFVLSVSCGRAIPVAADAGIIPVPVSQTAKNGIFTITKNTTLSFPDTFKNEASFLKDFIKSGSGIELKESGTDSKRNKDVIVFRKNDSLKEEAYRLRVMPTSIEIEAKDNRGAIYAVQSLRQLMPVDLEDGSWKYSGIAVSCVDIHDEPRFKYRGMHLDVGRHMFPVTAIKKYIRLLSLLKFNTFHWHLTEDQGWRIEIKKYPKLTKTGAYRDETLVGHYSDQPHTFDGKRYGGFYTQEEVKDIVQYAGERGITIIPEIEMPGHSRAALAAYPELGCSEGPYKVATKWGVFKEVYCPKEATFKFLEDVLDEVMTLFPSKYIHIGGDECPKDEWKKSPFCQKLIREKGLKDEHGLQSYFIQRIEKYLNSKGRQIIGWDEILEGGLAPNATVMSWRGTKGAVEAAKQHHTVILTPGTHCYFDHYQADKKNEPLAIGGYLPVEKVYSFEPVPKELTKKESVYVLGAQGNVWTEYIPNFKKVEYMAFPRAVALAEVVWSPPGKKDYNDFLNRLQYLFKRLDKMNVNYARHLVADNPKK